MSHPGSGDSDSSDDDDLPRPGAANGGSQHHPNHESGSAGLVGVGGGGAALAPGGYGGAGAAAGGRGATVRAALPRDAEASLLAGELSEGAALLQLQVPGLRGRLNGRLSG